MGKNLVRKTFTASVASQTFTAPAGVKSVTVRTVPSIIGPMIASSWDAYLISADGNLYAWGTNATAQVGDGTTTSRSSPVLVLNSSAYKFIDARPSTGTNSSASVLLLSAWGQVFAMGNSVSGESGSGVATNLSSPTLALTTQRFKKIRRTDQSCFGITATGQMYAWGNNSLGVLGVGDTTSRSSPVLVLGGITWADVLFVGATSVIGISTSGQLYGWGFNGNGQLGVGDVTPRSSPVAVLSAQVFASLASPLTNSVIGLTTGGVAYGWGVNSFGEAGVGDTNPRSSPVAVLGGLTFSAIVSGPGSDSFLGITTAGIPYAWGVNTSGELGVGDTNSRSSPVQVLGSLSFASIYAMRSTVGAYLGLTAGGALYAWGQNNQGSIGDGTTANKSSPVQVLGGITWAQAFPGGLCNYGVDTSGNLYSWGNSGGIGLLGDGTVLNRSSPVLILGGPSVMQQPPGTVVVVPVVPGTAYTIAFGNNTTLGSTVVAQNICSAIIIEYNA